MPATVRGHRLQVIFSSPCQNLSKLLNQPNHQLLQPRKNKIITKKTSIKKKINPGTVLPAKSDSDILFCLQSYQGLIIDRPLVY